MDAYVDVDRRRARVSPERVEGGCYPITYLSLEAIGGTEESHAVVVVEADEETALVYDLLHGERLLSHQSFTTAWAARYNLVILVER